MLVISICGVRIGVILELTFLVLGRATGLALFSPRAVGFLRVCMCWNTYSFSLGKGWDAGSRQNPHLGLDLRVAGVVLTLCLGPGMDIDTSTLSLCCFVGIFERPQKRAFFLSVWLLNKLGNKMGEEGQPKMNIFCTTD